MSKSDPDASKRLALIASKGSLDWAYPPFILASAAGAMGWEVGVFFTFYGLPLLLKNLDPAVSSLGNPAMPMKMPFGPKWFQDFNWPMPNLIMAGIPGFEKVATGLMKKTFKNKGVATVEELRSLCVEAEVKMVACQMTVDVFGFDNSDFIPEVTDYVGATSFLPVARKSDVCLFI
jgi:peroxiredoxin family protein